MFFGPLLTHSSHVTFPWQPLRHALHTYFGSGPASLDPVRSFSTTTRSRAPQLTHSCSSMQHKINSGWAGLSLILTGFKRLEVVESE